MGLRQVAQGSLLRWLAKLSTLLTTGLLYLPFSLPEFLPFGPRLFLGSQLTLAPQQGLTSVS